MADVSTSDGEGRGRLTGIARRGARRAPMETVTCCAVAAGGGLDGDHKGAKLPRRGVTILASEDWAAALALLAAAPDGEPSPALAWTERRANLLTEGLRLPRAKGAIIEVGGILLEVTAQTYPCRRMEQVQVGLMKTLAGDWRGGVSCRVLQGGTIRIGDMARVLTSPPEQRSRLPD